MNPIESLKNIKQLTIDYFTAAHMAPQKGQKVVYVNVFTPVELLYAMDFFPIYPENHAAICGARKVTKDLCPVAEGMGYSADLCSYARCDFGTMKTGQSPTFGLPKPDLLLICNAQCGTLAKWFEVVARHYQVPMIVIDVPHSGFGETDSAAERYVRSQLEELVNVLEDMAGKKLDQDRFLESLRLSNEASLYWRKMLEASSNVPSPMTVFDQFVAMFPIVSQRGTQVAVDFYKALVEELQERVAKGISAIENEKFRLFWDNLPIWPEMRNISTFLDERGAAVITSVYTWAWSLMSVGEQDPFDDWMKQYLYTINFHIDQRVNHYLELAKVFKLDGFLYHSNRSCKYLSQDIPEVRRLVTERSGLPGIIIEADHDDPRLYTFESIQKQISNFLDLLESKKQVA